MGTRKEGRRGSPSADAFTIRMGCKYDEEGKSGEIKITVCGEKRLRNKNKIPFFGPLTYALTRNSDGSRRMLVKMTFYSRRLYQTSMTPCLQKIRSAYAHI